MIQSVSNTDEAKKKEMRNAAKAMKTHLFKERARALKQSVLKEKARMEIAKTFERFTPYDRQRSEGHLHVPGMIPLPEIQPTIKILLKSESEQVFKNAQTVEEIVAADGRRINALFRRLDVSPFRALLNKQLSVVDQRQDEYSRLYVANYATIFRYLYTAKFKQSIDNDPSEWKGSTGLEAQWDKIYNVSKKYIEGYYESAVGVPWLRLHLFTFLARRIEEHFGCTITTIDNQLLLKFIYKEFPKIISENTRSFVIANARLTASELIDRLNLKQKTLQELNDFFGLVARQTAKPSATIFIDTMQRLIEYKKTVSSKASSTTSAIDDSVKDSIKLILQSKRDEIFLSVTNPVID